MFVLHGQTLALDCPFVDPETGVQYPANWLRCASPEERAAIGIEELPDPPPPPDQRFYWGWDADGKPIPKDHAQLIQLWSDQTRQTANSLLQPTDWIIIREADNGSVADPDLKTWRQSVRIAAGSKVAALEATQTTEELADYVTGPDYPVWPSQNPIPAPPLETERARDDAGRFVADDPATPEVNEAWVQA